MTQKPDHSSRSSTDQIGLRVILEIIFIFNSGTNQRLSTGQSRHGLWGFDTDLFICLGRDDRDWLDMSQALVRLTRDEAKRD